MNSYDRGDQIRITGQFRDGAGALIDPEAVVFQYRAGGGPVTTRTYGIDAALVKESDGIYYTDLDLDLAGPWAYRMHSTGQGKAAAEGILLVRQGQF